MLFRLSATFLVAALAIVCLKTADLHAPAIANSLIAPSSEEQQDDNIEIFRVPKPGRPKPVAKKIQAPLLAMQWWLMIRSRDCRPQEFDPKAAFFVDDRFRIGTSVNQSGFLYAVLIGKTDNYGTLIFPDPRINRGNNQVRKDTPVILPNNCPLPEDRDIDCPRDVAMAADCWLQITKYYNHDMTLIFSREKIDEFESLIDKAGANPAGTRSLPKLPLALLEKIKLETVQARDLRTDETRPQPGKMGTIINNFTTRVTNTNRRDNEEIIETITLKLQKR
ncbi:MAG: DUF4384 domain-containing protein [Acidobacteria bacterium]|nr:DUF4384 domain-containing protein [Acidobacteriota bacterium]